MHHLVGPIGSLLVSFGIVLVFVAGWMRLCDSGSDLAGRVLGAGATLLLLGWLMMECAGERVDYP